MPYEQYRKQVRISQKDLEKDLQVLTKNIIEICNETEAVGKDPRKLETVLSKLDSLLQRVKSWFFKITNIYLNHRQVVQIFH